MRYLSCDRITRSKHTSQGGLPHGEFSLNTKPIDGVELKGIVSNENLNERVTKACLLKHVFVEKSKFLLFRVQFCDVLRERGFAPLVISFDKWRNRDFSCDLFKVRSEGD